MREKKRLKYGRPVGNGLPFAARFDDAFWQCLNEWSPIGGSSFRLVLYVARPVGYLGQKRIPSGNEPSSRHDDCEWSRQYEVRPSNCRVFWERLLAWPLAIVWTILFASLSTRQHLVMMYEAFATLPWHLEPLAANYGAIGLGLTLAAVWLLAILRTLPIDRNGSRLSLLAIAMAVAATSASSIWSRQGDDPLRASFFDPILLSFLSGLAVYPLVVRRSAMELPRSWDTIVIAIASVTSAAWGWRQSHRYFENFSLGFNDLGHFAQRIASTAAGRGILLETPVLPPSGITSTQDYCSWYQFGRSGLHSKC